MFDDMFRSIMTNPEEELDEDMLFLDAVPLGYLMATHGNQLVIVPLADLDPEIREGCISKLCIHLLDVLADGDDPIEA